jgi:hypothetical protein
VLLLRSAFAATVVRRILTDEPVVGILRTHGIRGISGDTGSSSSVCSQPCSAHVAGNKRGERNGVAFECGCSRRELIAECIAGWERTTADGVVVQSTCLADCDRGGAFSDVLWTVCERSCTREALRSSQPHAGSSATCCESRKSSAGATRTGTSRPTLIFTRARSNAAIGNSG